MTRSKLIAALALCWLGALAAGPAGAGDVTNAQDHPLFPRVPGYQIAEYQSDAGRLAGCGGGGPVSPAGRRLRMRYALAAGAQPVDQARILAAYAARARALGGEALPQGPGPGQGLCGAYRVPRQGRTLWLAVETAPGGRDYTLTMVEQGGPSQGITTAELLAALEKDGRLALYLGFAPGQDRLPPEAEPILTEVALMMLENPALSLVVEGHTGDQGDAGQDQALSQRRAEAVKRALVEAGVDQARLQARGLGRSRPLTSGQGPEERARNQRVELVKE